MAGSQASAITKVGVHLGNPGCKPARPHVVSMASVPSTPSEFSSPLKEELVQQGSHPS